MEDTRWHVSEAQVGQTLAALVRTHTGMSWNQAKRTVHTGKVFVDGVRQTSIDMRMLVGQMVEVRMVAPRPLSEWAERARVCIVYDDRHVVVIDKPAGISSVPYQARETNTAMDLLRQAWRRKYPDAQRVPLHVVHRIDKATSGLLAFAKSKRAEIGLAAQLRAHSVEREYICAVHGVAVSGHIESRLVRDRGDGLRGSTHHAGQGKRALTHVQVIKRLPGRAAISVCRVRLETGKTHQIRIHLSERGHPLLGETVYIRDFLASGEQPIESPRLLLHARTLGFKHPISGAPVRCEAPLPEDFSSVLGRLGWSGELA
jgi:23S rRNA pseudouridine1911/1915/1917 synthase